jgi:hypothetical protein
MPLLLSSFAPVGSETASASWKELALKCDANACNFFATVLMSSIAQFSGICIFTLLADNPVITLHVTEVTRPTVPLQP